MVSQNYLNQTAFWFKKIFFKLPRFIYFNGIFYFLFLILYYFRGNIYENIFFSIGGQVAFYQLNRFLIIILLYTLSFNVGWIIVSFFEKKLKHISLAERLITFFVVGSFALTILLFFLGICGFLIRGWIIALALVILILLYPWELFEDYENQSHKFFSKPDQQNFYQAIIYSGLTLLCIIMYIMIRGLYPAGGHDYYNHYFHYYKDVVDNGSLILSSAWYHFFYSKGAVLHFLAMILSDPLGAGLNGALFVVLSSIAVLSIVYETTKCRELSVFSLFLYLFFMVYAPGPYDIKINGGWGDIEKTHEIGAFYILIVFYAIFKILSDRLVSIIFWRVILNFSIVCSAIVSSSNALFLIIFSILCLIYCLSEKKYEPIRELCYGIISASSALSFIGFLNYKNTGLFTDHALLMHWPFDNIPQMISYGAIFEIIWLHFYVSSWKFTQFYWKDFEHFAQFFRIEILSPILLFSIFVVTMAKNSLSSFEYKIPFNRCIFYILTFLFVASVVIFSLITNAKMQYISFYRYSTFTFSIMLCFSVILFYEGIRLSKTNYVYARIAIYLLAILITFSCFSDVKTRESITAHLSNMKQIVLRSFQLNLGSISIKEAYYDQRAWPGRVPWGGIYSASEEVWKILPRDTRVWSFHIHSYCMLPHCNFQTFFSDKFSNNWSKIYFGDISEAKLLMQREGLNYFFYAADLGMNDPLPNSPIFNPNTIDQHLGIKWTDGKNYLLTWKSSDTQAITNEFKEMYNKSLKANNAYLAFGGMKWDIISISIDKIKYHNGFICLPWSSNCNWSSP